MMIIGIGIGLAFPAPVNSAPAEDVFILTEAGDTLTTEGGDGLKTEGAGS